MDAHCNRVDIPWCHSARCDRTFQECRLARKKRIFYDRPKTGRGTAAVTYTGRIADRHLLDECMVLLNRIDDDDDEDDDGYEVQQVVVYYRWVSVWADFRWLVDWCHRKHNSETRRVERHYRPTTAKVWSDQSQLIVFVKWRSGITIIVWQERHECVE